MYCPGSNCSKRETCANHFGSGQLIDWSTTGAFTAGYDHEGRYHPPSQMFYCGDKGFYDYYTNSLGYKYDEECVKCAHSHLCFQYLELAGDITRSARPIFFRCADIKADPERMQKELDEKVAIWRRQMEIAQSSTMAHAEGGRR